jgi:PAS domain S-box-containing protein
MTVPQTEATTDPQSIIAALQQRLDAALAREATLAEALAQRNSEFGERIEHQAATIDVLKVMSASPGDPQPVFDLICRQAWTLLGGPNAVLFEYDGELVHLRAESGTSSVADATTFAAYKRGFPMVPVRGSLTCRAILDGKIIHIHDLTAEPGISQAVLDLGHRSQVSIPLMRDGTAIGAISTGSMQVDGISDGQIELLKTFAEQAVIAITSAEIYRALQTRTSDLRETLEYQTATSDVLKVISRSTFDLQPVLDTLVETAARLCEADMAAIGRPVSNLWGLAASIGFPPEFDQQQRARGAYPLELNSPTVAARAVHERRTVHIRDAAAIPGYPEIFIGPGKQRTSLGVPLLREGEAIGYIALARQRVEPFTDRQIELVSTFADQAVIAIENTRLITEQREALEQQTATAEVLQVINASPGNLAPVFDAMLERAMRLCGAAFGSLYVREDNQFRSAAQRGVPKAYADHREKHPPIPYPGTATARILESRRPDLVLDVKAAGLDEAGDARSRAMVDLGGIRTLLTVPLVKRDSVIGFISIYRQEVRGFTEKQIALLENFADQAVVAMENARLLNELRQRTDDLQESLEYQTAASDVLKAISRAAYDLDSVLTMLLVTAERLCGANHGQIWRKDDEVFRYAASHMNVPAYREKEEQTEIRTGRGTLVGRVGLEGRPVLIADAWHDPEYADQEGARLAEARSMLGVPLLRDGELIGAFALARRSPVPFTDRQVDLVRTFADQAVIAMENARLLEEIRQRQEELRVTFENMGDGVAMFDETPHLVAWNRKFQDILDLPDGVLAKRLTFAEYIRYLAERGEYGEADPEEQVRRLTEQAGQYRAYERTRPDGRVIEIRHNPVPSGGFVLIYADITERKRNEAEIRAARDAAEEASRTIEAAYRDLKAAQANLIQAEKMASLGQLTAGIAHEIKNPLNFVNNFAALSVDLLAELKETAAPGFATLTEKERAEIDDVSAMLTSNLEKITEHGKRADGIVRSMLEHSRGSSGERHMVDLNTLIDEALNLAYHGARAQDQSFSITLERDYAEGLAPIELAPQDMTRVFLNLFSNGFYAATRRVREGGGAGYVPALKITTREVGEAVEIRVRDNGTGIADDIRDKLFQPFFTTKPTGEGTGLGLSITYDIVTQQHGGDISVDSQVGEYSEFTLRLPRMP